MKQLNNCLEKLGLSAPTSVEQITAGIGGSAVYRVTLGYQTVVIKYTSPSTSQIVRARAEREYCFYHEVASRVPVNVPELLASFRDQEGYALALRCYQPLSMRSTTAEQYLQVVDAIARLHAEYWGKPVLEHPWLSCSPVDAEPGASLNLWLQLIEKHDLGDEHAFPERTCRDLFGSIPKVEKIIGSFPKTLCHGDYHAGNMLIGDQGQVIVSDWQEVMQAAGPEDLAFLLQRSDPNPLGLSDEAVIRHYVTQLNEYGVDAGLDCVTDVTNACKLHTMLLLWPNYLVSAPREWVVRIADGILRASGALGFIPSWQA